MRGSRGPVTQPAQLLEVLAGLSRGPARAQGVARVLEAVKDLARMPELVRAPEPLNRRRAHLPSTSAPKRCRTTKPTGNTSVNGAIHFERLRSLLQVTLSPRTSRNVEDGSGRELRLKCSLR